MIYSHVRKLLFTSYNQEFHFAVVHHKHVGNNPTPQTIEDLTEIQYIPINMHTVFALLCFVVVIHWLIFPYPSGLLHWHCGNLTIAPVPAKQPWWIWINTSFEFIMNDYITTTKQSTTKPCAYFLGYTVGLLLSRDTSYERELYHTREGVIQGHSGHTRTVFQVLFSLDLSSRHPFNLYAIFHNALNLLKVIVFDIYTCVHNK